MRARSAAAAHALSFSLALCAPDARLRPPRPTRSSPVQTNNRPPHHNTNTQVYHVTSGKTFASWLPEAKRRALRKDDSYRGRLELLQDFGFPAACQRMKLTPDGQYLIATGYHPPQVRERDGAIGGFGECARGRSGAARAATQTGKTSLWGGGARKKHRQITF